MTNPVRQHVGEGGNHREARAARRAEERLGAKPGGQPECRDARPGIVLGSTSPRRSAILHAMGLEFTVLDPGVPELDRIEDPVATVVENAGRKHAALRGACEGAVLITADTVVWFDGRVIGKPRTLEEAAAMLGGFSGNTQVVFSAVILSLPGGAFDTRVAASSVRFKVLSEALVREYLERVRPMDRAGAYDIDENGEDIIAGYSGSYTNIMGLPREVVDDWMRGNPRHEPFREHGHAG